jgi:Tfp pilus assembly protein PilV
MIKRRRSGGFLLLETMVGVAVFAIGVLALAKCVDNCLNAEMAKRQDQRARLALENRLAEIEAGASSVEEETEDKLEGMFKGITIKQKRTPLPLKNKDDTEVTGMYTVTVDAIWKEAGIVQRKTMNLYVYRP